MAVHLGDLMVQPPSTEENQKHLVGRTALLAGWGHSQIGPVEILMLLLTWLASETSLTGTPQKQDSKISLGGQAGEPPSRSSPRKIAFFPQSYRSAQRSHGGGLPSRVAFSWVLMSMFIQNHNVRVQRAFWGGLSFLHHCCFQQPSYCESFNMFPLKWHHSLAHYNDVIMTCWSEKRLRCIVLNLSNVGTAG